MGMFVNPGNQAFQVAVNSEIYVDKTEMLEYTNKVMNTLQGYICNSRPRRFGKSIKAQTAMQQIKEKKYPDSILAYTGNILLVAINYDKNSKKHQCLIEEYDKA